MNLPPDLLQFLQDPSNRAMTLLDGEVRAFTFCAPDEIKLKEFDVQSYELHACGLLEQDPEESKQFSGYDLIKSCRSYDPEGILVWFPQFRAYGSWDCDHHRIIIYPDVTWSNIMKDPTWYINGQWYSDKVDHIEVNPWARQE